MIRADFIRHLLLWSAILPLCSAAGRSRRGRLISLLALRVVLGLVVPIELVEAALVFRLVAAVTSRRIRTAEGAPATSLPGQHPAYGPPAPYAATAPAAQSVHVPPVPVFPPGQPVAYAVGVEGLGVAADGGVPGEEPFGHQLGQQARDGRGRGVGGLTVGRVGGWRGGGVGHGRTSCLLGGARARIQRAVCECIGVLSSPECVAVRHPGRSAAMGVLGWAP
ncbi:DUF6357 family protein [Streptomyces sp. NPDC056231]|uniref:DUF6357 family protein n=1 Tax=Streptomyces sp. NPDC056231 TaxID=3345755 RepID=UPI003AAC502B